MAEVVRACEWDSWWACDKEDVAEVVRACEWDSG